MVDGKVHDDSLMGVINSPGACLRLLRGILAKNGTPKLPFLSCCGSEKMGLGSLLVGVTEVTHLVALLSLPSWCPKSAFGLALWLYLLYFLGSWSQQCIYTTVKRETVMVAYLCCLSVSLSLFPMSLFSSTSLLWVHTFTLFCCDYEWNSSLCWFTLMPWKLKNLGQDIFLPINTTYQTKLT